MQKRKNSSWQNVSSWYNRITKKGGHYYHQHIIIPKVIHLLNLKHGSSVLDLACGNGVLGKSIPKDVKYVGVDLSENLIKSAKYEDKNMHHKYVISDITKEINISDVFTNSTIILALQNIKNVKGVFINASKHLVIGGHFVIVLNHPMFRIPRQTSWGIDEAKKLQYRRVDKYLSPMDIPINMNPGDKNSEITMSYHYPLSYYSQLLKECGFMIENIDEWTSDKESVGKASKMENRARGEIPLFMAIVAKKV